jgi:hypothetical protein
MNAMPPRSEGVALRPFAGLGALENYLNENVRLEITSNASKEEIISRGRLGLTTEDITRLGVRVIIDSADQLRKNVDPIVMNLDHVSVFLVARDRASSVLRENFVLAEIPLKDLSEEFVISEAGSDPPHRILSNSRSGFRIEFALVQNTDVPGENSIRPRKKGALIALSFWEVKPVSDGDAFQPKPLTDEIRKDLALSSQAWLHFDGKEEILTGELFTDAASFYVDMDLLSQIQILTGEPKAIAEMFLYSSAVTHMVYEFSMALRQEGLQVDPEQLSDSQLFRLFRKKFDPKSDADMLERIKDEPGKVITDFLSKSKDYKNLLAAIKELNGGSDELSDFDD